MNANRFVAMAASVPHVGELKGLLWVDTDAPDVQMIFVALDENAGNAERASLSLFACSDALTRRLPPPLVSSLTAWLSRLGVRQITSFTMTTMDGRAEKLPNAILGMN